MKHITRLFILLALVLGASSDTPVHAQYYRNITRIGEYITTSQFNKAHFCLKSPVMVMQSYF